MGASRDPVVGKDKSGHNGDIERAAHGYEATREAAIAKNWQGAQ
jgi:hypothetical protein